MGYRLLAAGLGKSRQVEACRQRREILEFKQLGYASLGKSRQVGGDGKSWNSNLLLHKSSKSPSSASTVEKWGQIFTKIC